MAKKRKFEIEGYTTMVLSPSIMGCDQCQNYLFRSVAVHGFHNSGYIFCNRAHTFRNRGYTFRKRVHTFRNRIP